jgi:hypothetical protein
VEGHSLNDRPRLAKTVAAELSKLLVDNAPTEANLLEFLNGQEGRKEIEEALHQLRALGVHGIPKFIIEGATVVDGAARSEVFVRVFREIEERGKLLNHQTIFGSILGIPDEIIQQGSHQAGDIRMRA